MNIIETRNHLMAQKLIANLERRHFEAYYCPTAEEAKQKTMELMPEGSSVTWGGSMTIRDMGLPAALKEHNYEVYDRDEAQTGDDVGRIYRKAFSCDFYLSSANAISEDGIIVNIDGNGNRVAAIAWGPKRVIFLIGVNKVAQNVETALSRARSVASPINCLRFDKQTPCQNDGLCHNCMSKDSICNQFHFLRQSHPARRHVVILIGEHLGY